MPERWQGKRVSENVGDILISKAAVNILKQKGKNLNKSER